MLVSGMDCIGDGGSSEATDEVDASTYIVDDRVKELGSYRSCRNPKGGDPDRDCDRDPDLDLDPVLPENENADDRDDDRPPVPVPPGASAFDCLRLFHTLTMARSRLACFG